MKEGIVTRTYKEKIAYLLRYHSLLKRIELMSDELIELQERRNNLQSISVIQINKESKKINDRMLSSLFKIEKSYTSLMDKIDEATEILESIYAIVDSITDNEVGKNILICRYIKNMTFEEIADKLGYSCVHIQRLHKKTINSITII